MEIIPYSRSFTRDKFSCGQASLDNYILKNATKDVKSGSCTCFVTIDDSENVLGYYTLSADNISKEDASYAGQLVPLLPE